MCAWSSSLPTTTTPVAPSRGDASYWDVTAGGKTAESAAWSYLDPTAQSRDIAGYLSFYWNRMDGWYEEEDEIFVHARDPYKRVDVLQSSRHVQVTLGGEVVADSRQPRLVIETGHLIRYYLPREDVRMELMEPSDTRSRCPYKGYRPLLVRERQRQTLRGHGLELRGHHRRMPQDQGLDVLLQRAGGIDSRGRGAVADSKDQVVEGLTSSDRTPAPRSFGNNSSRLRMSSFGLAAASVSSSL